MAVAYGLPGYGPDSTGAPGTGGIDTGSAGAVIGNPTVSVVYGSSQVRRPVVEQTSGDTAAFSDDLAVHEGGPFLAGGTTGSSPSETGAGRGNVSTPHHPNAGQ